jgi:beta-ketoacyl-acyl-carrier-protein synthase II
LFTPVAGWLKPEPFAQALQMTRPKRPRVVVTGMGALAPNGNTVEEFWQNCLAGISGIGAITAFDVSDYDTRIGGEVKNFDPKEFMDFKEARRVARNVQFAIAAAKMTLRDAGFDGPFPEDESERVGVIVGTAVGGYDAATVGIRTIIEKGWRRASPFALTSAMPNAASYHVSLLANAKGFMNTIATACAAGTMAIGEGLEVIRRGAADVMLVGGTETAVIEVSLVGFGQMRALSTRNALGARASSPFDAERDGLVPAEGCGMLVIEKLEHALAREARIYGEIVGYAAGSDAYHVTAPNPEGMGAMRVMQWAIENAGISTGDIDYINAHGTSTPLNDLTETRGIKKLFGPRAYQVPISSTKSLIGHTIGAGGALEAIVGMLTLRDQTIHPTINLEHPDPECDLDYVPDHPRPARVRTILSNSFGMGGQNACLVFKKYEG